MPISYNSHKANIIHSLKEREEGKRKSISQYIEKDFSICMNTLSESTDTYRRVPIWYITSKFKSYQSATDLYDIFRSSLLEQKCTYERAKQTIIVAMYTFVFENFSEFLIYFSTRHGEKIEKVGINSEHVCKEFKKIHGSTNYNMAKEAYDDMFDSGHDPLSILNDMLIFMHYELKNYNRHNSRH